MNHIKYMNHLKYIKIVKGCTKPSSGLTMFTYFYHFRDQTLTFLRPPKSKKNDQKIDINKA